MALEDTVSEILAKDAAGVSRLVPTFRGMIERLTGGEVVEAAALSVTTGGTAQQVFAANAGRKTLAFSNTSNHDGSAGADMYVRFGDTAASGVGHLFVPGGALLLAEGSTPLDSVSVWCAVTGARFYAWEL